MMAGNAQGSTLRRNEAGAERRNEQYSQQVKVELCLLWLPHGLSHLAFQQENCDSPAIPAPLMCYNAQHLQSIKWPAILDADLSRSSWATRRSVQSHREGCQQL